MSPEELLKPRYKVIAEWPNNKDFKVGDIIQFDRIGILPMQLVDDPKEEWLTDFIEKSDGSSAMYCERLCIPYPHLFKKLEWWEEREMNLSGMYVRFGDLDKAHSYYKLLSRIDMPGEFWQMQGRLGEHQYPLYGSVPATEEDWLEYLNYINTQSK